MKDKTYYNLTAAFFALLASLVFAYILFGPLLGYGYAIWLSQNTIFAITTTISWVALCFIASFIFINYKIDTAQSSQKGKE